MCSIRNSSFGSTMDSSLIGTVECQVYERRLPLGSIRISELCSALVVPSSTLMVEVAMLTSGACSMWKVSVPMRLPLTKMPKLPASTTSAFAEPLDTFFWSALRGVIAVALTQTAANAIAMKNLASFVIVTVSPPAFLLRTTIRGSRLPLHPLACPWSQCETALPHKLLCDFQRARRTSLRLAPAVSRFRQRLHGVSTH